MKVVNMQLDCADPIFIYSHMDDLPFLKRKIEEGTSGILKCYTSSATSWASFWTGQPPEKHEIFGFWKGTSQQKISVIQHKMPWVSRFTRDHKNIIRPLYNNIVGPVLDSLFKKKKEERYIVRKSDIKSPISFEIMEENRLKIGLINCLFTYPPWETPGYIISDWSVPMDAKIYCYPHKIQEYLDDTGYIIEIKVSNSRFYGFLDENITETPEDMYRQAKDMIKTRKKATIHLMNNYEWDFHATLFRLLDNVQHLFIDKPKIMLEAYKLVDTTLQEIEDKTDTQDCVWLINSDHSSSQIGSTGLIKGGHDPSGFYCFVDRQGIFNKGLTKTLRIEDLMPIVLHLFNLKMVNVKGEIPLEIFKKESQEEVDVKERLKALGYL